MKQILLFLILSANSYGMHLPPDDIESSFKQFVLNTAKRALQEKGIYKKIDEFQNIPESQLKDIKKDISGYAEMYSVKLPDGSLLRCEYFNDGPIKGKINCYRNVESVLVPVSPDYFMLLKKIEKREQKNKSL